MNLKSFWWHLFAVMALLMGQWQASYCQNHLVEHFGKTEGLRNTSQFYCFQDSKLKLWFGSDHGVVWYDGGNFHGIEQDKDVSVLKISEDRKGRIWFHTLSGIPMRLDGPSLKMDWDPEFMAAMKGAHFMKTSAPLADGGIVYGTQDGRAAMIDGDDKCRILFQSDWGSVQMIENLPDGSLAFHFSKNNALGIWKNEHLQIKTFKSLLLGWTYGSLRTTVIGPGRYIYAVENRIAIVQRSADTLTTVHQILIPQKNIIFAEKDYLGDIWIGTTAGALQFKAGDSLLQSPRLFLEGTNISCVRRDHEGGLWFTGADGVYHCQDEQIRVSAPAERALQKEATAIYTSSNGRIYVGYGFGEVEEVSRATLKVTRTFPNTSSILEPRVLRFFDAKDGSLIIAGHGGIKALKGEKMILVTPYKVSDIAVSGNEATVCLFSNWTRFEIDPKGEWMQTLEQTIAQSQSSRSNRWLHCAYDNAGSSWVSTFGEMIKVNGNRVDTIRNAFLDENGYKCAGFAQTRSGQFMYGTTNIGLRVQGKHWQQWLNKSNGLLDNTIVKIYEDQQGFVWIITSQGLSKARITSDGARVVSSKRLIDLFGTNIVNDLTVCNDTLWAAAEGGYVFFPTQLMDKLPISPSVSILRVWANNIQQPLGDTLRLPYDQNYVRIQFRATTFVDPKTVEYRYRILAGGDRYQISTAEYIELLQLSPGKYLIEIQARHPMGNWSTKPAAIWIDIKPPFWQTWWFRSLAVLFTLIVIGLIIRAILLNARRKSALRESLSAARHDALINQMNPHFVFNSLNSIQSFILNHETETANNYLADFAALMRSILVNGRSATITLSEEIKFLNLYLKLEALRLDNNFEFTISTSKGIVPSQLRIPTMMLQPLLENAIWHGVAPLTDRKGSIETTFSLAEKHLICKVTDNGIGRKMAAERAQKFGKKHQSLATTIMQERIELMNGSIEHKIELSIEDLLDAQGQGIGTEVTLYFPITFATRKET